MIEVSTWPYENGVSRERLEADIKAKSILLSVLLSPPERVREATEKADLAFGNLIGKDKEYE